MILNGGEVRGKLVLEMIREDLVRLGVKPFDLWSSEKKIRDLGEVRQGY